MTELTEFNKLLTACGLSLQGAATLLKVSYESVRSWKSGRRNCPAGVLSDLEKYRKASDKIFNNDENNING